MVALVFNLIAVALMSILSFRYRPEGYTSLQGRWSLVNCAAATLAILSVLIPGWVGVYAPPLVFAAITCGYSDIKLRVASRWVLRVGYIAMTALCIINNPHLAVPILTIQLVLISLFFLPGFGASDARAVLMVAPLLLAGYSTGITIALILAVIGCIAAYLYLSKKGDKNSIPFVPIFLGSFVIGVASYLLV